MGKKVLSIEVGLHQTRVCELEAGKKNPHVFNCITFDTPENIVEDGFILDKDLMAQTLKTHLSSAKMTAKEAIFTIASTKLANREVVIPMVRDDKIQSIIDASATEYFPLDVSEYTISYSILEKINTKEEKKIKLLLLAAPNNLIKNIYSFAEIAGLRVQALDYIGNSAYQLLKNKLGAGVNVSVMINDQTTIVNIMENEKLALQRAIPYGSMNIVSAVLDNSVFNKNTSREAMQLLMQEGIINAHIDMGGEASRGVSMASDSYDRVMREIRGREEVTNTIQYIMNNVNRVLDYYMSRNSDKRINAIYLTGIGSKFKGIEILFSNETGFDVKRIESLFGVAFNKGLSMQAGAQADYLAAIGATIAPVGFVPEDIRGNEKSGVGSKRALLGFGLSCAVGLGLIGVSFTNLKMAEMKQSSLTDKIDEKSYIENVYETHRVAKESYLYSEYMYNLTSNRNYQLNELKEELASVLPTNMKVTSLTSSANGLTMNIEAKSNKYSIAELLIQLKKIPSISDASISTITENIDENGDGDLETFTVVCSYTPFSAYTDEEITLKQMREAAEAQAEAETQTETTDTVAQ